ncbi:MAG TPA: hypothetical protein VGQ89_08330 [Candidatus Limnocylindrales bacterium]|jgi:hypothetical protein|nr:hypothetical protein [Candidatus Limnocylindrales bacterium]
MAIEIEGAEADGAEIRGDLGESGLGVGIPETDRPVVAPYAEAEGTDELLDE